MSFNCSSKNSEKENKKVLFINIIKSNIKLRKNGITHDKKKKQTIEPKGIQNEKLQTSDISFSSVLLSSLLLLSLLRVLQIYMQKISKFKS